MDDVPKPLWHLLEAERVVAETLDPFEPTDRKELRDQLLRKAKRFLTFHSEMGGSDGLTIRSREASGRPDSRVGLAGPDGTLVLSEPVMQRAWAFSVYLAKVATEHDGLRRFREDVLGGTTISYEEAEALLLSKAAAYYPPEWFAENDVPIVGHSSEIVKREAVSKGEERWLKGTMRVWWEDGELSSGFECVPAEGLLEFRAEGERNSVPVMKDSILENLGWGVSQLVRRFPWLPIEVPMFILTGVSPFVPPIEGTTVWGINGSYEAIRMTVEPWVPVEAVSSWYKALKKDLNTTTTPIERRMALYMFVMSHPEVRVPHERQEPVVPSWRILMRSWNEYCPKGHPWHYGLRKETVWDPRNMRRDFLETYNQVVNFYR